MSSGGLKDLTSTLTMKNTSYSGHCRGQFFSISGDRSQCSNHESCGYEKLDLAPDSWHNKIPDYGDKFDNCDHTLDNKKLHHISQEHIQRFGRNDKSSRCEDWLLRRHHERDQLYQFDNLSKSQNQRGTSKNKSSDQEFSRYNDWCIWKDQEKLQEDRYEDLSKTHNQSGTKKNKSSDHKSSRYNKCHIRRDHEKSHLD